MMRNIPRLVPIDIEYNPVLPDYRYIENDSFIPARHDAEAHVSQGGILCFPGKP